MKKILNIGISHHNPESLNRKIKLHNLIVLFITIVCIAYIPMYIHYELFFLLKISFLMLLVSLFCLFLQHKKKYEPAFVILILGVMILLDITSLQFGLLVNTHFFQLCSCMTAITFFDKNKIMRAMIIGFSLISFFGLILYLHNKPGLASLCKEINISLTIYGYVNLAILFAFTIIFFTSFVKQSFVYQEKILNQNAVLKQKNEEITKISHINDSIRYAKHIQDAILPPVKTVKNYLQESFILYKPKDIVAGDFYWLQAKEDGKILFAAADSTGHGVPGAMVSVVCTNALNQAVKEFGLNEPGLILDKVRELVTNSFQKSDGDGVKDGMDISLCLIDTYKRTLKWAGANNPLWIIKKDSDELTVIKPDKQSVSKSKSIHYRTHLIQ